MTSQFSMAASSFSSTYTFSFPVYGLSVICAKPSAPGSPDITSSDEIVVAVSSFNRKSIDNYIYIFAPQAPPDDLLVSAIPAYFPATGIEFLTPTSLISASDCVRVHSFAGRAADGRGQPLDPRRSQDDVRWPFAGASALHTDRHGTLVAGVMADGRVPVWNAAASPALMLQSRRFCAVAWVNDPTGARIFATDGSDIEYFNLETKTSRICHSSEHGIVKLAIAPESGLTPCMALLPQDSNILRILEFTAPVDTPVDPLVHDFALPARAGAISAITWIGGNVAVGTAAGCLFVVSPTDGVVGDSTADAPITGLASHCSNSSDTQVLCVGHGNKVTVFTFASQN